MNQASQYIFNLYHYLLNLRDTLEFTLPRDHELAMYEQRKRVLKMGIEKGSALGNFLEQNKEQGDKIRKNLEDFIDDVYGDNSTVLMVSNDKVRVDHTQHLKIYEYVVGNAEAIRDIVYGYINFARSRNELEPEMSELMKKDEVLYRTILAMLVMRDFEKSFAEFQKVMGENQGKPSPQSNFIVQNEINKMSGFIRFSRQHCHATDNKTLDLLDEVNEVIEMCEGRRDRREKTPGVQFSFKEIFDNINNKLNEYLKEVEPVWKECFDKIFNEAIEAEKNKQAAAEEKVDA